MDTDVYLCRKDISPKGDSAYYVHLELSTRELRALGDLVSQWSLLESMIEEYSEVMAKIIGSPSPKEIYSDSFRKRVRAMAALARLALKGHADLPEVLSVFSRISALQGQAHKLRHGLIQWNHKNRNKLEIRSRKNPMDAPWVMDAKGIEKWARKVAELNAAFLHLHGPEFVPARPRREHGKPVQISAAQVGRARELGAYTGPGVVSPANPRTRKRRQPISPGK